MGTLAHHTIVVTGWDSARIKDVRADIVALAATFDEPLTTSFATLVSDVVHAVTNDQASFFIAPDGSKEGWPTSDQGDRMRAAVVALLRERWVDFIEVRFGGDDYDHAWIEHHGGDDV